MAFARTWVEELIAEWMQREGYLVETGIPIPIPKSMRTTKRSGGRREADVVGARRSADGLDILHVETGAFLDQPMVMRIKQKFSASVRRYLTRHFAKRFPIQPDRLTVYRKRYVVTYPHERQSKWTQWVTAVHKRDRHIQVDRLEDFIQHDVLRILPATGQPTLPEGLWLLCLVHYLWEYGVCGFGSPSAQQGKQPKTVRRVPPS